MSNGNRSITEILERFSFIVPAVEFVLRLVLHLSEECYSEFTHHCCSCPFDVVKVYDGGTNESAVIGTYCGQQRNLVLYSSESTMFIVFETLQRTATTQNRGFKGIFEFSESFVKLGKFRISQNRPKIDLPKFKLFFFYTRSQVLYSKFMLSAFRFYREKRRRAHTRIGVRPKNIEQKRIERVRFQP